MARRLYCLRCFGTLPRGTPTGTACDWCGHRFRPAERKIFWNLSPLARLVEWVMKAVTIVATILLTVWVATLPGSGRGFVIAGPLFFAVLLWRTASTLTRHESNWSASLVWAVLFSLLATALVLSEAIRRGAIPPIPVLATAAVGFLIAIGCLSAGRLFRAWKSRRMAGDEADGD